MRIDELLGKKPIPLPPKAKVMYHCTLARNLPSISKQGLIASKGQNYPEIYNDPSNKDIKFKPGVWLATTPDYSQSWIHDIAQDYEPAVILEVDISRLDPNKFIEDPYIPDQNYLFKGTGHFAYLYQDSIPKASITLWGEIKTLDSSWDDGDKSAAYYGGKQVREIKDAKEWHALFDRIKNFLKRFLNKNVSK